MCIRDSLYGEKALIQRSTVLANRMNDDPFISGLVDLNNQLYKTQNNNILKTLETRKDDTPFTPEIIAIDVEKKYLKSLIVDKNEMNAIQFTHNVEIKTTHLSKGTLISQTLFGSLLLSILIALMIVGIRPNKDIPA